MLLKYGPHNSLLPAELRKRYNDKESQSEKYRFLSLHKVKDFRLENTARFESSVKSY